MEKNELPNVSNEHHMCAVTLPEDSASRSVDVPSYVDTEVPLMENLHKLGSRSVRFSFEDHERIALDDSQNLLRKDDLCDTQNSDEERAVDSQKRQMLPANGDECKILGNASKTEARVSSSEYVIRASAMRNKIEEKITEIEEKMNLPNSELNSESLESITSPPDYDMIKVLDARRSRSLSVSEMRQSTIDRLQSNLEKAEKDLELREEEVAKLRKIRDEVGSEIEDLTASLFEEANNIVKKAHMKQQRAEKIAKEANMKLGMLQDEVRALKAIVEACNVSSPSIDTSDGTERRYNVSQRQLYEVDPIFNKEYISWRQNPNFNKEDPFLNRIYEEDILPSLNFANKELTKSVLSAIEEDKMIIEKILPNKNEPLPKTCALMDAPRLCPYRMYLDGQNRFNISALSRNRITAICDLFCYFRYLQKGLITSSIHEVYLEILKKRRRITSAKLGLIDDILE